MQNVLSPGNKIGVLLTKPNVTNVRFYGLGAMEGVLRGFLEPTVPGAPVGLEPNCTRSLTVHGA